MHQGAFSRHRDSCKRTQRPLTRRVRNADGPCLGAQGHRRVEVLERVPVMIELREELLVQAPVNAASGSDSEYEDDNSVVAYVVDDAGAADADTPPPGRAGQRIGTPRAVTSSMTRRRMVGSSFRISLRAEASTRSCSSHATGCPRLVSRVNRSGLWPACSSVIWPAVHIDVASAGGCQYLRPAVESTRSSSAVLSVFCVEGWRADAPA